MASRSHTAISRARPGGTQPLSAFTVNLSNKSQKPVRPSGSRFNSSRPSNARRRIRRAPATSELRRISNTQQMLTFRRLPRLPQLHAAHVSDRCFGSCRSFPDAAVRVGPRHEARDRSAGRDGSCSGALRDEHLRPIDRSIIGGDADPECAMPLLTSGMEFQPVPASLGGSTRRNARRCWQKMLAAPHRFCIALSFCVAARGRIMILKRSTLLSRMT
jgi:hypothetical protein